MIHLLTPSRPRTPAAPGLLRRTATRIAVGLLYAGTLLGAAALRRLRGGRARQAPPRRGTVLVLGTFYARNWGRAHLAPLAAADPVRRVFAVVDGPCEPLRGVRPVPTPPRVRRILGRTLAKLLTAWQVARRLRPEVVVGYHLVPCGLLALLVARFSGAQAVYQLTGGPIELDGGGHATENIVLSQLGGPTRVLERLAYALANRFDLLVVRGARARQALLARGLAPPIRIIPGSIDEQRFAPAREARTCDLVSVGRLVEVKQPWQVLELTARLRSRIPNIRTVLVGDGPLLPALRVRAAQLQLTGQVQFAGHVESVEQFLARSRVFVLTSRSEGLSIALGEAMAAGVVPVVADVGELGELVRNGQTGWRIPPGDLEQFSDRIAELLLDPDTWSQLSSAARRRAVLTMGAAAVRERWSRALADLRVPPPAPRKPNSRRLPGPGLRRRVWERTPRALRAGLAPLLAHVPPARWLGGAFRQQLAFAADSQHWPPERQQAWQLARLRALCTLAYERTTYYHGLFESLGVRPDDVRSLADFAQLPLLDPETLRNSLPELCTRPPTAPDVDLVSTGGTGGRPLRFPIDRDRSATEFAFLVSSWQRAGFQLGLPQAVFRGDVVAPDSSGLRHAWDPILRRHLYSNFHMTDEQMRRYLAHVATLGPCYLLVYPSSVSTLARFLARDGQPPPANIRGILAGSENVYPAERAFVERVFGVRYFSWYGHSEKAVLAAECEHSSLYHVWPTYGYFELLDDDGRPVTQPGQRGEIVGTSFINTVAPFIRYRTGDYATYVGDRCAACGRAHPVLRDIRGHRTHELLVARDGALLSWTALNMHDGTFDAVRQFQFRQEVPGEAVLRIVPAGPFNTEVGERLLASLARKLEHRLRVRLELVAAIPVTPRGKATYVDQRLNLRALGQEVS